VSPPLPASSLSRARGRCDWSGTKSGEVPRGQAPRHSPCLFVDEADSDTTRWSPTSRREQPVPRGDRPSDGTDNTRATVARSPLIGVAMVPEHNEVPIGEVQRRRSVRDASSGSVRPATGGGASHGPTRHARLSRAPRAQYPSQHRDRGVVHGGHPSGAGGNDAPHRREFPAGRHAAESPRRVTRGDSAVGRGQREGSDTRQLPREYWGPPKQRGNPVASDQSRWSEPGAHRSRRRTAGTRRW